MVAPPRPFEWVRLDPPGAGPPTTPVAPRRGSSLSGDDPSPGRLRRYQARRARVVALFRVFGGTGSQRKVSIGVQSGPHAVLIVAGCVRVAVERRRCPRVAHHALDDVNRDDRGDEPRRVGVSEIVKPESDRQSRPGEGDTGWRRSRRACGSRIPPGDGVRGGQVGRGVGCAVRRSLIADQPTSWCLVHSRLCCPQLAICRFRG